MTLFSGLSAFPLTPTDNHGRLMPDVMAQQLERLSLAGVDSVGLLGSTGSYAYLSPEERKRMLRVAADALGGRVPLIVGVGALRTDEAEALARDAAEAGANGLLLAPVSYQKLTEEEVYQHFKAVAAAGGLPLCIYNNPGTTNFIFSPDLIARLSQVPHIAGVKMPLPGNAILQENWPICGLEPQKALSLDTAVIGAQKIRCSLVGILGLALWPVCCLFRRSGLHVQQHLEIRRKQPNLMRRSVHFGRCSRSSAASVLCMRSPTLLTAVELNHCAPCNHLRLMFD